MEKSWYFMSEFHKIGGGQTLAKGNTKASNLIDDIKAKLGGPLMDTYKSTKSGVPFTNECRQQIKEELETINDNTQYLTGQLTLEDEKYDNSVSKENINKENALKIEKYNKELLARIAIESDKLLEVENKIKTKKEELQNLEIERVVLYGRYTSLLEFGKDIVTM